VATVTEHSLHSIHQNPIKVHDRLLDELLLHMILFCFGESCIGRLAMASEETGEV
jgi:hypothetical protein